LRSVDPESAEAIHPNNVKRVVRALEIYEQTGIPKSEFDRRSQVAESPYEAVVIGLHYPRREVLYERINRRVDVMIADGLLEETKQLKEEGVFEVNLTAAQAIGYKELLGYLDGSETLAEATESLKTATRRYAKR
jgi:tRNA dimethylallyltransferase